MFAKVKSVNTISLISRGLKSIIKMMGHAGLICDTQTFLPR